MDTRGPNYATGADDFQMPDLEAELASNFHGCHCFSNSDFAQDYWQIPIDADSAEVFTFPGVDGLYVPTRVPQGARNAATRFQRVTHALFEHLGANLRQYLDDIALNTTSIEQLIDLLRQIFVIYREKRLF